MNLKKKKYIYKIRNILDNSFWQNTRLCKCNTLHILPKLCAILTSFLNYKFISRVKFEILKNMMSLICINEQRSSRSALTSRKTARMIMLNTKGTNMKKLTFHLWLISVLVNTYLVRIPFEHSLRYSAQTITDADEADDIAFLANIPAQAESCYIVWNEQLVAYASMSTQTRQNTQDVIT